jgi:hypothetical protein
MIKKNGLPNVPSEVTVEDFLCQMPGIGPRHEHTIQEYRKGLMEYLPALCLFIRELFAEEQRIRAICIFQSSEELVEALTMKGMTPHTIHAFLTNLCPEIVSAIHMKVVPPQIAAEWIAFFGEYDWSVNHEQEASFERMVKILHGLQKSGMATDEAIGIFVRCFSQFKVGQLENRTGVHYDPFERYESP